MSPDEIIFQVGKNSVDKEVDVGQSIHHPSPWPHRFIANESVLSEAPLVVVHEGEALPHRARHVLQSGTPLWGVVEDEGKDLLFESQCPGLSLAIQYEGQRCRLDSLSPVQTSSLPSSPLAPKFHEVNWIMGCFTVFFCTIVGCFETEMGQAGFGHFHPLKATPIPILSALLSSMESFMFARKAADVVLFDLQPFAEFDSIWAQMPAILAAIVAWLNTSFIAVAALSAEISSFVGVSRCVAGLLRSAAQCHLILVLVKVLLFRKAVHPDPARANAVFLLRSMAAAMVVRTTAGIAFNPTQHLLLLQSIQSNLALHFAAFFLPTGILFYMLCFFLLRLPREDGLPQLSLLSAQINTLFFHVPFVWADRKVFLRFIFIIGLCIGINIAATDLAEPRQDDILGTSVQFTLMVLMPMAGAAYWLFLLATTDKTFSWGEETKMLASVSGLQLAIQGALLTGSMFGPVSQLVTLHCQAATVVFVVAQSTLLCFRRTAEGALLFVDDSQYFVFAGTQNWFFVLNISRVFVVWTHLAHGMLLVASGKEPLGPLNIFFFSFVWVDFLYQGVALLMPKLAAPSHTHTAPALETTTPKAVSNISNVQSFRSSDMRSLSFSAWEAASASFTSISNPGLASVPALTSQGSPLCTLVAYHSLMSAALLALLFSTSRGLATLGLAAGPNPQWGPTSCSLLLRSFSSSVTIALIFGPIRQALQTILPTEGSVQTSISLLRVWKNYAPMVTALCSVVFYSFLLFQGVDAALHHNTTLGLVASLLDATEALAWLYFTHCSLAVALPLSPERQVCPTHRLVQVFAAWRVLAVVVWVVIGADPLAQLTPVMGNIGGHYLSTFVFPLHLLYFLVLALRLRDAEEPSESISSNLLLVSLPSMRYAHFLYCCLGSCLVAAVHAALNQTSLFGPASIPGAFLLLDVLVLIATLYCIRLLYTTPKRLHWSGTSQLLLVSCAIAVAFSTLKGLFAQPKDAAWCGPRQTTVCVFANQLVVSCREVFFVVQAVLLCHRQTGNTHNTSLPIFFSLNMMLFVSSMLEVEQDFYTQVDWSSFLQFICQSFGFAYYGLVVSLYTEQIWKAAATFSGGQ
eukprot:GGOE01003020.1.p1 GENE.GGOE01003020.1~~GGOE01003020.1.p1  ORF type:complete len:1102 (+),score=230.05 GGOE01003020.1:49-3306(+)